MNGLDFLLLGLLILAFLRGLQSGFVRQFFSTIGFLIGLFVGAWVQAYLIGFMGSPQSKAWLSLIIIMGTAVVLMAVGEYVGLRLKDRLHKFKFIDKTDRTFGALIGCVAVLLAIWLGAAIFMSTPIGDLQQRIRSSRIVGSLNRVLPDAPKCDC